MPFSFFPVTRDTRRWGLYDALFAVSPWAVMQAAIRRQVVGAERRAEALAFVEQSREFHAAATARIATNPLLLYYSFLNLGKAMLRVLGYGGSLDLAMHGLSSGRATDLESAEVSVQGVPPDRVNVFAELVERLGYDRPANGTTYPVLQLLPQIVVGHRIWREIDRTHTERFIGLNEIEFVGAAEANELWLRLYVEKGDLQRYSITRKQLLAEGGIQGAFREVRTVETGRSNDLACFEQEAPVTYTGRPTDVVMDLIDVARPVLWRIVTTNPTAAYRKYYLHLTPDGALRLPQVAALWCVFFYFGSVVRYRPHLFTNITEGRYGAFVTEFISAQSEQLIYLLASEMCGREIARPAII